jgi:hypothetical protein
MTNTFPQKKDELKEIHIRLLENAEGLGHLGKILELEQPEMSSLIKAIADSFAYQVNRLEEYMIDQGATTS